jgi:16S rRNA (uracil1498-N3)-methyltransferase
VEPASAAAADRPLRDLRGPDGATIFVGPEGGWAPEEIAGAVEAGALPITLGARTLRADAVALVALSILLYAWDAL